MALFQKSVLNKYLREINDSSIAELYSIYSSYFLNLEIQQNIRDSKEEQFQEGFLRELFVNVLGYTINPNPNYNLTTELKNETGAKKADGAIMVNGKAIGVIELKSTSTKDLESIRQQAFDYKSNQSECVYVVTSNFEKLRFYIDNAVDFEEFDLFTLSLEQFKLLYLCLHVDSIMAGIPKTAKIASLVKEENVTKKLYADYSVFKEKLFNSIIGNEDNLALANGTDDKEAKLILFKKTQKLMDRFLFIFFAEDRGLIPPNTISTILAEWEKLKSLDAYRPLYDRFKRHFDYINAGWKGDNYEVFAYNGGLFLPDEILDNITISDEVLYEQTTILTKYDFDSEVDVNILGHIFEHSLNEIETMNAELEGQQIDLKKTKRKKDGVFYTPKYITKYIVDNTIGKLCEEKKGELSIVENDYLRGKKGRKKDTVKQLETKLTDYRDWLLQITVVDPACGSGAFLNQALEFLIREHRWIDEMTTKLFGGGLVFQDVENSILENNLYGVDINEESVEIAKLSLWLRTAQKGRKLTSLNNNIKCGNSLIDDPEVAGDKAFKWEEEFPKVFAKGGFDVVIGNPPYVDIKQLDNDLVKYLFSNYKTTENRINLYSIFVEMGYTILKGNGKFSFIIPNSLLMNSSYMKLRSLVLNDISTIIKLPDNVFRDASVETIIFIICKQNISEDIRVLLYKKSEIINEIEENRIVVNNKEYWKTDDEFRFNIYMNESQIDLINKIKLNSVELNSIVDFTLGITPYDKYKGHSQDLIKNKEYHSNTKIDNNYKPLISGGNVNRYHVNNKNNGFIKYGDWLGAKRDERFFKEPRIIVRQIISGNPGRIYAGYTDEELYFTQIGFGIIPEKGIDILYLLALLNSKLLNFYHRYCFLDLEKELFQKILIANCKKLPIKLEEEENSNIRNSVKNIISNYKELDKLFDSFIKLVSSKYGIEEDKKFISNWQEIDFKQFLAELKKKKVVLTISEEAEWMSYFNEKKTEAQELKAKIDATDNEIDLMVYKLYDLTYDEVLIVDPETSISREVYGGIS